VKSGAASPTFRSVLEKSPMGSSDPGDYPSAGWAA
jgi:hypothetical protein